MFMHQGDIITVAGVKVPLHMFLQLEPSYQYPADLRALRYDGSVRHYKAGDRSWIVVGRWEAGDRFIAKASEFAKFVDMANQEEATHAAEVEAAAKYAVEEPIDVKLHNRGDLVESGTEGVRPKSKRAPRSRSKRDGGAT